MKSALFALLAGSTLLLSTPTRGEESAKSVDPRFEMLKSLAGTWTGAAAHGDQGGPVTVIYEVTAGGSTVLERLFAGTAHEMVTMYYMDGQDLLLTHYCAMGNQPRMKAVRGDDPKTIRFEFLDATNLASKTATHMHEGHVQLVEPDHLKNAWTTFVEGKPAGDAMFDLTRVKE